MSGIKRDALGRYATGTACPNLTGCGGKQAKRRFTSNQVTQDFLELLDEPVAVVEGGKRRKMPAIKAIYRLLVKKAAEGDWPAMKMVVQLREQYVAQRTETLGSLLESATNIRARYDGEVMPDEVWAMVDDVERLVAEGQFRAG